MDVWSWGALRSVGDRHAVSYLMAEWCFLIWCIADTDTSCSAKPTSSFSSVSFSFSSSSFPCLKRTCAEWAEWPVLGERRRRKGGDVDERLEHQHLAVVLVLDRARVDADILFAKR